LETGASPEPARALGLGDVLALGDLHRPQGQGPGMARR